MLEKRRPLPAMPQCHEPVRCERRCTAMRSCGRHQCKRRCCNGDCPPCEEASWGAPSFGAVAVLCGP